MNNLYLIEIDGEVFETYIPSPEEEALKVFNEKYGGFNPYEEAKGKYLEQRADRIENEHYKWGHPRTA